MAIMGIGILATMDMVSIMVAVDIMAAGMAMGGTDKRLIEER